MECVGEAENALIINRFVACCQCIGYCQDTGRYEYAKEIQKDLHGLIALARKNGFLCAMLERGIVQESLWVVCLSAGFYKEFDLEVALKSLRRIEAEGKGLVATLAMLEICKAQ